MAYLAFLWGDGSAVDAFLRGLFRSWPSFPEERRSALREALFAELAGQYRRPARDFESNPPPWLNRNIPNPKGYLATKVFKQAEGILGKRKEADELTRRIAQLRDDALTDLSAPSMKLGTKLLKKSSLSLQVVASTTPRSLIQARSSPLGTTSGTRPSNKSLPPGEE